MNRLLRCIPLLMLAAVTLPSCKKLVEDKQRDMLLSVMTNGKWHVEVFEQGSSDISTDFSGYSFQFSEDGVVTGFKDSSRSADGTWTSDVQNLSITSNFPQAEAPIVMLNGTWKITDSGVDYVVAEMITPAGKNIIHLRKNA